MSKLKPVGYIVGITGRTNYYPYDNFVGWKSSDRLIANGKAIPLYAIPDGYHIVAIDAEQEARDMLDDHNEKVRSKDPRKGTTIQAY